MEMLENLFGWVIAASFYGTVVALLLFAAKALLRKQLSPRWHYALWMILLIKLLLPQGPESIVSVFNVLPEPPVQQVLDRTINREPLVQITPEVMLNQPKQSIAAPVAEVDRWTFGEILALIWVVGVVAVMCVAIGQYGRLQRLLRRCEMTAVQEAQQVFQACKRELNMRSSVELVIQPRFSTPVLLGLKRKKLLINEQVENMSVQQQRYIYLHELWHIRRKDLWVNGLMLMILALHWFNPVLWYCHGQVRRDMELACDEAVLRHLGESEWLAYGHTLLSVAEQQKQPLLLGALALADDYKSLKERIQQTKQADFWQKHCRKVATIGGICMMGAVWLLLTDRDSGNHQQQEIPQTTAQQLYAETGAYIGTASAVGRIRGLLPLAQYNRKMALQTTNEPYGAIFQMDFRETILEEKQTREQLYRNSAVMMALVGNLGRVDYQITTTSYDRSLGMTITRADIEASYGGDVRQYAQEQGIFERWLEEIESIDISEAAEQTFYINVPARNLLPINELSVSTVPISFDEGYVAIGNDFGALLKGDLSQIIVEIYQGQGQERQGNSI